MESNKEPLITPPKEVKLDLSESPPQNSMSVGGPNKKIQQQVSRINYDDDDDDDDDCPLCPLCCCCFCCAC
jgi:hypothetical protein